MILDNNSILYKYKNGGFKMNRVIENCPICNAKISGESVSQKEKNYFIHIGKKHDVENSFYLHYKQNENLNKK